MFSVCVAGKHSVLYNPLQPPPPSYRVFLFVAQFFLLSSFLVTRFVFVFDETFFWGGANTIHFLIVFMMVFLRLQGAAHLRISATPQIHLQTVHIYSYVLISEMTALAILLSRGHFWCCNFVVEGKRGRLCYPRRGKLHILLTSVERGVCCICTALCAFGGPIYGF